MCLSIIKFVLHTKYNITKNSTVFYNNVNKQIKLHAKMENSCVLCCVQSNNKKKQKFEFGQNNPFPIHTFLNTYVRSNNVCT
jgi:hypothetical protein